MLPNVLPKDKTGETVFKFFKGIQRNTNSVDSNVDNGILITTCEKMSVKLSSYFLIWTNCYDWRERCWDELGALVHKTACLLTHLEGHAINYLLYVKE